MKNKAKRLMSLLLACVLLCSLSVTALAENGTIYANQIALNPSSLDIFVGNTVDLTVIYQPNDCVKGVRWTSSDASVASVYEGKVSALKTGTTTITAYAASADGAYSSTVYAACTVNVRDDGVSSISIGRNNSPLTALSLKLGASAQLTATAQYNSGVTTNNVNWSVSSISVATVSTNGNVLSSGVGTGSIVAELWGQSASLPVYVYDITSVGVSGSPNLSVGSQVTFSATPVLAAGSPSQATVSEPTWSSSNTSVATVSSTGLVTGVSAGSATIKATVDGVEGSYTVKVNQTLSSVTLSSSALSIVPGRTAALSVQTNPSGNYTTSWSSDNERVATYNPSTGLVTALAFGTAHIRVSVKDENGATKDAYCTVTVEYPKADYSVTTYIGAKTVLTSASAQLSNGFSSSFGNVPSSYAKIDFSDIAGGIYGTLYTANGTAVTAGTQYNFSDVAGMYFTAAAVPGQYAVRYTLSDTYNQMSGTMTFTINSNVLNVSVTLDNNTEYLFSSTATSNNTSICSVIEKTLSDMGSTGYDSISFGSVSAGTSVGTLYANSGKTPLASNKYYSIGASGTYPLASVCFVPATSGTYQQTFYVYNTAQTQIFSGTLSIVVPTGSSTVSITLDNNQPYYFYDDTSYDGTSGYSRLDSMIYAACGQYCAYINMGSITSGNTVGTLYSTYGGSAVNSSMPYYRGTSSNAFYNFYFVPVISGTYCQNFTAYNANGAALMSGTLKVIVPATDGAVDLSYSTTTGGSVDFNDSAFSDWYKEKCGDRYSLSYVTIDSLSNTTGSFKNGTTALGSPSGSNFYTRAYTGTVPSGARYLDNLTYIAPSTPGYLKVGFTCHGSVSVNGATASRSGTMYIFYTKGSVAGVELSAVSGTVSGFTESSFTDIYKTAMGISSAAPSFYIVLQNVPGAGTLYANYSSATNRGTALTESTCASERYYVNSASSNKSVENLTYVPSTTTALTGSYSVDYIAYSAANVPLYKGTVTFGYTPGKDLTCTAEGYTFALSDIYNVNDSSPIAFLNFTQPTAGKLYAEYANGSGVLLDSSTRIYTVKPTSGKYPLTSVTYIPRSGAQGVVSVAYTAQRDNGSVFTGSVIITVSKKTASTQFTDVTASNVGSWAADSIDYAFHWGLVNGTDKTAFSPTSTMTRAMLVTILYRAAGSPKVSGTCPFTDVAASSYYYDAVLWANRNSIVNGLSDTQFGSNNQVTREQLAAFLYRYADYQGKSVTSSGTLSGYTDRSSVSSWATDAMTWCVANEYITSSSASALTLSPSASATRAQVAVMLHRFLTY